MQLDKKAINLFQNTIWQFYVLNKRIFPWRWVISPYKVLVSEIMLQQTQTFRVEQKYDQFLCLFPNFKVLGQAELKEVLKAWQGLGYNRRAQYLHQTAKIIINEYKGDLPKSTELLVELPGIGANTAASICAFAFNMPTVFIETNIRTAFLYTFFRDKEAVDDKDILPLIGQTLDQLSPREWYYALMDYGSMLKRLHKNPSRKSRHYTIQKPFEGSDRQIRSMILKVLLENEYITLDQLINIINRTPARVKKILAQMCKERIIKDSYGFYKIS